MFNRLFGKKQLTFDPALGDPLATSILREAQQGRINTLLAKVDRLRHAEWDQRAFYVDLAGKYLQKSEQALTLPDTPLGDLIRGSVAIRSAWDARGGGDADTVTESGWRGFVHHLNIAGESLVLAAERDPDDPTPLAFLQTVAMGLQLDRAIAERWHAEALRRDPYNQQAHYRRLFLLCKKWGGSHEEMYDYARETVARAQLGSTLPIVLYLAFQEHYLYTRVFEPDPEATRALLLDPSVREETVRVYKASLQQRPRVERVSDYWPHNIAIWWLYAHKLDALVRVETRKIGPYFTEFPWSMFFGDPAAAYQKVAEL